jgi:hypothetical protein
MTNQEHVVSGGTIIGHGEPAVWAATIDDKKTGRRQGPCKQLREVIAGARPNLSIREALALEKLIADYQYAFETNSGDHKRTERVYQRIGTSEARPIRQPPR